MMTSKTRRTMLALGAYPESRPIRRTLREHWEDATAKKFDGVHEFRSSCGELVYRFRIEPEPFDWDGFECRIVIDDRPRHDFVRSAAEVRAEMMAGL